MAKKKSDGFRVFGLHRLFAQRYLKFDYADKFAFFPTRIQVFGMLVLFAALIWLPFKAPSYATFFVTSLLVTILAATGLHILLGLTGVVAIGHNAFMAIGAYAAFVLKVRMGVPLWIGVPAGGLLAAALGVVVAWPSLRLRGFYSAMIALALSSVTQHVLLHWDSVTRGPLGITVSRLRFPWGTGGTVEMYFVALLVCAAGLLLAANLSRTDAGRALQAIRDRDNAAEVLGVPPTRFKVWVFAIGSFYGGIAGALMALNISHITPEMFELYVSLQLLTILMVGGIGSIQGVIFGAIFITAVPEVLKVVVSSVGQHWPAIIGRSGYLKEIVFGLVLILCCLFAPRGLVGLWADIKSFFRRWPFSY